ncbi:MAG TPA: PilW family protein, partial [Burkholderiales bacterium]|nr:PilW family protein [Burkholderiales bacterium]
MRARRRQSGLSLIELMIAMTLGMILALAIGQIFLSSRFTSTSTNENARMQENARFALGLLERELRMAGYLGNGSTGTFSGTVPVIAVTDGTGLNSSDEIKVSFYGSDSTTVGTADNTIFNCIGEAAALNQAVVDRFYIATGSNGEPSLFCDSVQPANNAVTTTTELINGVESMQFLLGEDTNSDTAADRYLGPADPALNISNAVGVKISLLLRSSANVTEASDNRKFNHFGQGY